MSHQMLPPLVEFDSDDEVEAIVNNGDEMDLNTGNIQREIPCMPLCSWIQKF